MGEVRRGLTLLWFDGIHMKWCQSGWWGTGWGLITVNTLSPRQSFRYIADWFKVRWLVVMVSPYSSLALDYHPTL